MQITTWHISIKLIFEHNRYTFLSLHGEQTRDISKESVKKILGCRDPDNWFAAHKCDDCGDVKKVAFSCKCRFCNSCGTPQSDLRINRLVQWRPTHLHYFHLAFTIPEELRDFFKTHRRALVLLREVSVQAIIYFYKKKYKVNPWVLAVIHTFWAKLNWNPHIHLIVSAWWFREDGVYKYVDFIPYMWVLASWKYYLLKRIKEWVYAHVKRNKIEWIRLCNVLYSQKGDNDKDKSWYIYFSDKATSFTRVLSYIGRYLKRPTISESRILMYDGGSVTFQYKDKYDDENKVLSVDAYEFIWLLVQHIPNKHFHMISYHGIFANRCKKKYLSLLRTYFNNSCKLPEIVVHTKYADRKYCYTWKDPRVCECWWRYFLYSIVVPWYLPKYFDSW